MSNDFDIEKLFVKYPGLEKKVNLLYEKIDKIILEFDKTIEKYDLDPNYNVYFQGIAIYRYINILCDKVRNPDFLLESLIKCINDLSELYKTPTEVFNGGCKL